MKLIQRMSDASLASLLFTLLLLSGCALTEVRQNRAELRRDAAVIDMTELSEPEKQFLKDYQEREFSEVEIKDLRKMFGKIDLKSLTDAELIAIRRMYETIAMHILMQQD